MDGLSRLIILAQSSNFELSHRKLTMTLSCSFVLISAMNKLISMLITKTMNMVIVCELKLQVGVLVSRLAY